MTASRKTLKPLALAASLFASVLAGPVSAGGIPVVDMTNFAQNIITATKVTEELRAKYEEMRLNYMMLQNARGNMQQVPALVSKLQAMESELVSLHGSLGQARTIMEQRYRDYAASGTENLEDYYALEKQRADHNIGMARANYMRDRQVLSNVNEQYQRVQALQGDIEASTGPLQQQQLLNSHMNLIATQNAQLLEMMAAKGISEGVRRNEESAQEESQKKLKQEMADNYTKYHGELIFPSDLEKSSK